MQASTWIFVPVMAAVMAYCYGQGNRGQGPDGQGPPGPPSDQRQSGLLKFGNAQSNFAQGPEDRPGQGHQGQGNGQGQGQFVGIRTQAERYFTQGQGPDGQGPPVPDREHGQGQN